MLNTKLSSKELTWIKASLHIIIFTWVLWVVYLIFSGGFGGDPVKQLTHYLGKGALHLLILTLLIGPLAKISSQNQLMRLKRPLGLWCLFWATLHIAVWIVLDIQFDWQLVAGEIVKRTYILLGAVAWLLLFALGVTSIPYFIRKLKKNWKRLHNSVYFIAILVGIHYWWSVKSGWIIPFCYLLVVLILVIWRFRYVIKNILGQSK